MMKFIKNINEIITKLKNTGFIHIFGSRVINQMITFLSGIALVRIISKTQYGVYTYTNNIMSFFMLLSGLGITSGILQICSEQYDNPQYTRRTFIYGTKLAVIFNVILGILIAIFSFIVPLRVNGANSLLTMMSMLPVGIILFELIQVYYRYNRLNKMYSYYSSTNTLIILTFSVVGAILWSIEGLIFFRYLAYIISISIGIVIFKFPRSIFKEKVELESSQKHDLLKLSLVSMVNNSTGHLIYILDIFIVGLVIPNESVIASYKVATIIPNALIFIPASLMVYVYPYFASHKDDKKWVSKNFFLIIKYFGVFNLLITIFLMIFAPLIIKIIFGIQYLDAVAPFRILSLGYFFSATFRKVVGNLLVTQRKLKFNFWLGIVEGVINIISNIILVNYMGSIGAAITSLVIVILSSIIGVRYFLKVVNSL